MTPMLCLLIPINSIAMGFHMLQQLCQHPYSTDAIQHHNTAPPPRVPAKMCARCCQAQLPKKFARSKKSADSMRCHGIGFYHILSKYPPPLTLIRDFEDWHSLKWQWKEQSKIRQSQCTKKGLHRCTHWNRQSVPCNADSCRSTTTPLPRPSSHIFCIFGIQCAYHRGHWWPKQAASGEVDILHRQRLASANTQLPAWL